MLAKFRNYYECWNCGHEWSDDWECQVDDRCPNCNSSTEPYESEDLITMGKVKVEVIFWRDMLIDVKVHSVKAEVKHTFLDFERMSEAELEALPDDAEDHTGSRVFLCEMEEA